MRWMIVIACAVGCGNVTAPKDDAPVVHMDSAIDSPPGTCTVHDQITSCGATCAVCGAATDREMATCDGTACGMGCAGGNPRCSDNTCSRLVFDFNGGNTQGAVVVAPVGVVANLRTHNGSPALAFDYQINLNANQLEFHVPVCVTGNIGESTKTLKAAVFFEGGTDPGDQYYIQGSIPTPTTGDYLNTTAAAHNVTINYAQPMSQSAAAAGFNNITFRIGSLGASFTGTIWVDDIKIE